MVCEINKSLGEKILYAKNKEIETKLQKEQEEHYLICSNPICKENLAYLKKHGLFQMNDEQQKKYDQEQKDLEAKEDRS